MATYFHGNSEIQGGGDGLQTLILMNPAYAAYSDGQQTQAAAVASSNYMFLNSNAGAGNGHSLTHAPQAQTQHFVGVPLPGAVSAMAGAHQEKDVSAQYGFASPRLQYNLYNLPIELAATREVRRAQHQQGLSLSLSSQQSLGYGGFRAEREVPVPSSQPLVAADSPNRGGGGGGEDVRVSGGSPSSASAVSNGVGGVQSVLLSSKYLKAAQELLDEVANVGKATSRTCGESSKSEFNSLQAKNVGDSSSSAANAASGDGPSGGEGSGKRDAELSTAERQEIQMKKAKLVNMLDEVEQRYRQYHHRMQSVVAWFEQAAGNGSAKAYTAIALQTISRQFRCLKDAILGQIRAASRSLGEDETMEGKTDGSRLKYVDNQIRQQRALQQLGMIQHNAWRPQRGLPERSVSVLRAWLFEHFLHPYPKDSDKVMLAKQTGLTRSQVSNWFINARVRLWKPMVEEMYMEEMKENERNATEDKAGKREQLQNEESTSKAPAAQPKPPAAEKQSITPKSQEPVLWNHPPSAMSISTASTSPTGLPAMTNNNFTGFNLIRSSGLESIAQSSPKKLRTAVDVLHSPSGIPQTEDDVDDNMAINKFNRRSRDGFTLMGAPTNFIGGFGSYPIAELGRFTAEQYAAAPYSGNGVSLTLGLPHSHCDNLPIPGAHHQSFLPNQSIQLGREVEIADPGDFGGMNNNPAAGQYENLSILRPDAAGLRRLNSIQFT